jgi:uncharacterized DUF497 family protein
MFPPVSWTEQAEEHIARHAVRPAEVEQVLYGRPRYVAAGRSGTTLVFGTSAAGRHLLVVIGAAPDGGVSIVTAREMTETERRTFRRKGN